MRWEDQFLVTKTAEQPELHALSELWKFEQAVKVGNTGFLPRCPILLVAKLRGGLID
jgi:hypothetical protein